MVFMLFAGAHWLGCLLYCFGGYRTAFQESHDGNQEYETVFDTLGFTHSVPGVFSSYAMAFTEALYMLIGCLDNPIGDGSPREKQLGSLVIVAVFGPVGCIVTALLIS